MKIRPLADMVLLESLEHEQVSKGGIIIPDTAKEKPVLAKVVAVGPGGKVDGKDVVMYVKEGETVVYRRYAGTEIKLEGKEYILARQSDIIAVVEK